MRKHMRWLLWFLLCWLPLLGADTPIGTWLGELPKLDGSDVAYGYGFNVREQEGYRRFSHSGGQSETAAFMLLCPEKNMALTLMCNTEGTRHEQLAADLLSLLLAHFAPKE